MKYIEIRNTEDNDFTQIEYHFLEDEHELYYFKELDFSQFITMLENRKDNVNILSEEEINKMLFDYIKEIDKDYIINFKEEHEITILNINDKNDIVDEYIYNGYLNEDKHFEKLAKVFNLQFGTVGYSQWSYYLAISDIDSDYISDLYEGYNFYDFYMHELNESNELEQIEVLTSYVKSLDFKDYDNAIRENFGIDDYKIIENTSHLMYIDVPKELLVETVSETITTLKGAQSNEKNNREIQTIN